MKEITDFDLSSKQSAGGQTGSLRVKGARNDENLYQLKPSVLQNKYSRQIKAGFSDRENFSEVIASFMGRAFLSDEMIPEVSLVYDVEKKRINVASRYLVSDAPEYPKTLDDYAESLGVEIPSRRRHVIVQFEKMPKALKGEFSLSIHTEIPKQDLCDAIALSAMLGDHDVNPGNFIVLKKQEQFRIARIDFGHAFNELLSAPRFLGGGMRLRDHPVLDFFNRMRVSGAKIGGDQSKLKRDYRGLTPSMEMVVALRKMADIKTEKLDAALNAARSEFELLLVAMLNNNDNEGIAHVKKSLASIYQGLQGKRLSAKLNVEQVIGLAFDAIRSKTIHDIKDALQVANVMELQLEIKKTLNKTNDSLSLRGQELLKANDFPKHPHPSGKICWVAMGRDKGFKGDVWQYICYCNRKSSRHTPSYLKTAFPTIRTVSRTIFQSFKQKFFRDPKKADIEVSEKTSPKNEVPRGS